MTKRSGLCAVAVLLLASAAVLESQSTLSSVYAWALQVGDFPIVSGFSQGVPVVTRSNLSDDGSGLSYKGTPLLPSPTYTLSYGAGPQVWAPSTTYYLGQAPGAGSSSSANYVYTPAICSATGAEVSLLNVDGTPSSEAVSMQVLQVASGGMVASFSTPWAASVQASMPLGAAKVVPSGYATLAKITTPAWATPPINSSISVQVYCAP